MKNQLKLSLVLLGVAAAAPAIVATPSAYARPANVAIHTPKPGSKERAAIMNALRIPVTKSHKGKRVTFTNVREFRVGGNWAHLRADTVDANNKRLTNSPDYPDSALIALLRKEKGQWRVMEWGYSDESDELDFKVEIKWAYEYPDVALNVLGLTATEFNAAKESHKIAAG